MLYPNPNGTDVERCYLTLHNLIALAPFSSELRFHMKNGETVFGRYEGVHLTKNDLGHHCFVADVRTQNAEDPTGVDLCLVESLSTLTAHASEL